MTRKRAVKLMMARGHSRNRANAIMYHKNAGESNFWHSVTIARGRDCTIVLVGPRTLSVVMRFP